MQLDKLTQKSSEALQEAQRLARESSHQEMDGEHLLLAQPGQSESLVPAVQWAKLDQSEVQRLFSLAVFSKTT